MKYLNVVSYFIFNIINNGVKSGLKLYSSKRIVTDRKTIWTTVSFVQQNHWIKSKKQL